MIEHELFKVGPTYRNLVDYHDAALAREEFERAVEVFGRLRELHPYNIQLAGLHIAACLRKGDDAQAMDAIEQLLSFTTPDEELINAGLTIRERLGAMRIDEKDPNSISLCMIMRDESENIGRCLHQIKPLVNEIILVDTGSRDRSVEIGKLFGGRVNQFVWQNDFSIARNHALALASGRWILVLDVDETIAASDFQAIKKMLVKHQTTEAFSLETRNYSRLTNAIGWRPNLGQYRRLEAGLGWIPSTKVRLFRNRPDIRFHYPVHERVEPALRSQGFKMALCTVPVHHYGHLNEARNQQKALEYYQLGYTKLSLLENDPAALRELAVQAGQLERWAEAIDLWHRLIHLKPAFTEAFINIAGAYWQLGQYAKGLSWANRAIKKDDGLKEAHYNAAINQIMMGRVDQALDRLIGLCGRHQNYLSAHFMLAAVYGCRGEKHNAAAIIAQLGKTISISALLLALEDLIGRLDTAGQISSAENLKAFCQETVDASIRSD